MPKGNKIFGALGRQVANFSLIKQIIKQTLSKVRAVDSWQRCHERQWAPRHRKHLREAMLQKRFRCRWDYLIWSHWHLWAYHISERTSRFNLCPEKECNFFVNTDKIHILEVSHEGWHMRKCRASKWWVHAAVGGDRLLHWGNKLGQGGDKRGAANCGNHRQGLSLTQNRPAMSVEGRDSRPPKMQDIWNSSKNRYWINDAETDSEDLENQDKEFAPMVTNGSPEKKFSSEMCFVCPVQCLKTKIITCQQLKICNFHIKVWLSFWIPSKIRRYGTSRSMLPLGKNPWALMAAPFWQSTWLLVDNSHQPPTWVLCPPRPCK